MKYYVGILEGSGKMWSIRVPDLPGCHGGGKTAEAAIEDTASAMREWAETILARGREIPSPRAVKDVIADPKVEFGAGESIVMLPLLVDAQRSVKANISLDADLLAAIDFEAKRRGLTRSAFLASAAIDKIKGRR